MKNRKTRLTGGNVEDMRVKEDKMGIKQSLVVITLAIIVTIPTLIGFAKGYNEDNIVSMDLKAEYNRAEDVGHISWETPNYDEPYIFQVYSRKPGSNDFQTISATDLNREVKVLNVYPNSGEMIEYTTWEGTRRNIKKAGSVEMWMETPNEHHEKGYGMGLIDVDPVLINDFNGDPNKYLKDSNGDYKYDVIFFGSWDSNGGANISDEGVKATQEFVETGRGLLMGHDTLRPTQNDARQSYAPLAPLANVGLYHGRKTTYTSDPWNYTFTTDPEATTLATVHKEGLLTKYPWEIGNIGTTLTIPYTHTVNQIALGDIWLKFGEPSVTDYENNMNFYLTTYSNSAMIQTGHSNSAATLDEQKVLANTLFYLAQLTEGTDIVDRSAMDVYAPEFKSEDVNVVRGNDRITVDFSEAIDPNKQFDYYIKATGQDTNNELFSKMVTTYNSTGLKGYSYVLDNRPDTMPDDKIEIPAKGNTRITIPNDKTQTRYAHISAVDNAGNVSEPLRVDLKESFYRVDGVVFVDMNENGVRDVREPVLSNHPITLMDEQGNPFKQLNGEDYTTVTDRNGYYRFDVYTGGRFRVKVQPKQYTDFTRLPEGRGQLSNHVGDRNQGLTDVFELSQGNNEVIRNGGFLDDTIEYTIKHINKETGENIEPETVGTIDGSGGNRYIAQPIPDDNLEGYTYTGNYTINNGKSVDGTSYIIERGVQRGEVNVTYLYEWEGVSDTTKRMQGDGSGTTMPLDSYTNASIYTKRDVQGKVTDTGLTINSTMIIDEYEAPIAMIPRSVNVRVLDSNNNELQEVHKSLGNNNIIINTSYLDGVRVTSRVGNSRDVNNRTERVKIANYQEPTYNRLDIKSSLVNGAEEVRELGVEDTNATLGVNEDDNYIGRWVNQPLGIEYWTPEGIGGISTSLTGKDKINNTDTIQTSYEVEIYNILEHTYEPRIGTDGVEYYQYTGSVLKQGHYLYNNTGERTNTVLNNNTAITQRVNVDVKDLEVGSYINADGYTVNNRQITPVQRQVATEVIDDGGQTLTGHRTEEIGEGMTNPVDVEEGGYTNQLTDDRVRINYYEEITYIPFSDKEELLTQQAVSVGGKLYYVDPYDYAVLPSYEQLTVNEENGKSIPEIQSNVETYYNTGYLHSDVLYDSEHTGVYVSDVDEYGSYEGSIPDVTSENKQYLDEVLRYGNEVSPYKYIETPNYNNYLENGGSSRYETGEEIPASTHLEYKLPLTYIHNTSELLLRGVVAVGQDSGYPVYSHSGIVEEAYRINYQNDIGNEPTESDKLITTNKGSIYLIPLNNKGQTLEDEYQVREYIDKIGTSQVSLVNDKTYTIERYLYGRGDNVVYSGQREEVEVTDEFRADQMIHKDATYKETTRVNGIRTGNNKKINKEILEEDN